MTTSRWITLDGVVNMRDLGGLPTVDGRRTKFNRMIRSDNLQSLTASDVRRLIGEHDLRAVADLRTGAEVQLEGPGPLTHEVAVVVHHFSLFPEAGQHTDAGAVEEERPVILPWTNDDVREQRSQRGASGVYLGYLDDRPDSVLAALRLVANTDGATIVHCAAGKDRTGVVSALALGEVGVEREAIVEDYALSGSRIEAIFDRLRQSSTYADDLPVDSIERHRSRTTTMEKLLGMLDEQYGGISAWLRTQGWTEDDSAALRAHLLD